MAIGRLGLVGALFGATFACAHGGSRPSAERAALPLGHYQVESIRSRANLDGVDQFVEISEVGSRLVDAKGGEHLLMERGALVLASGGHCRLALAVSVDGEEPGVSDRTCTWEVNGDVFFLGDRDGTRTAYKVMRSGDRLVLEGIKDFGPDGKEMGDASGERIVLVQGPARASGSAGPINEARNTSAEELPTSEL
jgi:hypothetical protein